jgi:phospholipid/cholesterol/gamma-HCH transport system substrate-binding protein
MAENLSEVIAGGAVLAAAVGFLVYAGQSTGYARSPDSYPLTASFRSVDGVSVGTDVRLAGVKVGTVTALSLNPQTYFAETTISLRKDVLLPDDSTILISSEGLLGGNFVELQPGGSPDMLAPGAEIEDTQGAVSLISLLLKFVGGGSDSQPAPPAP